MNLTSIIIGEVVTEKAERLKLSKVFTLKVNPKATKIDVKNALRKYYNVEPENVRIVNVPPKTRVVGRGKTIQKRHRAKHALVKLSAKSKPIDLTTFQIN
jgi:large subunit ribosomal protein L23